DCLSSLLRQIIGKDDFQFDFGKEIDRVFTSAIDFCVTFLTSESFYFGYRHSFHADFSEGFFDFLKLEGLDDCLDFFECHICLLLVFFSRCYPCGCQRGNEVVELPGFTLMNARRNRKRMRVIAQLEVATIKASETAPKLR